MSKINNGGPAFPVPGMSGLPNGECVWPEFGMTLRDYFAAKAMQGMLANTDKEDEVLHRKGELFPILAVNAYAMADAMLAASEKGETK